MLKFIVEKYSQFFCWNVNITWFFIKSFAIIEHSLNIKLPLVDRFVSACLDVFFNCKQINWTFYHAYILIIQFNISKSIDSNRVNKCCWLFMVPEMACDVPNLLNPVDLKADFCKFVIFVWPIILILHLLILVLILVIIRDLRFLFVWAIWDRLHKYQLLLFFVF